MLASEVSYVMSEMTAKGGKLLTEASFWKSVYQKLQKAFAQRKRSLSLQLCSQDKGRGDHRLGGKSQAAGTFFEFAS